MILVFDIGNTNIKTAVFDNEKTDGESVLLHVWRISTDIRRTGDEYFSILSPLFRDAKIDCQTIEDIVLSSVVPALIGPDMYDKLPVKVPALLLILAQPLQLTINGNDFSGFAIPTLKNVDKAGWADRSIVAGSTSIFTANEKYASNKVCKSYPEQDAPFNFSDKYKVQLYKCNCGSDIKVGGVCTVVDSNDPYSLVEVNRNKSLWNRKNDEDKWNGNDWCVKGDNNSYSVVLSDYNSKKVIAFSYEQFQNFSTNDYLRTVLSSVSLPYYTSDSPAFDTDGNLYNLIWVDDSQECYYKKVQYENVNTPAYHYFGSDKNIQSKVCYSNESSKVVVNNCNSGNFNENEYVQIKTTTEGRVDTNNSKIFGNCIEYSYSNEIYYPGSGKYNCITWIPGYISK